MWTNVDDIDRMFGAMDLLRSRMNRFFTDFDQSYGQSPVWRFADGLPRTNLYDNGDQLEIRAEVPGLSKDEINIKMQGNYLELNGSRKADLPEGYQSHRTERSAFTFTRSLTLPSDVDVEKAEASLKDGILTLTLPKAETAKPKQIAIK